MILITKNNGVINAEGHAEDTTVCAMYTALTIALLKNITERLKLPINYELEDGLFVLDTKQLYGEAKVLVDSYLYAVRELKNSFPRSFNIKY